MEGRQFKGGGTGREGNWDGEREMSRERWSEGKKRGGWRRMEERERGGGEKGE